VQTVPLAEALGRVPARDVVAPVPLPGFARSTVDGYAVRAADARHDRGAAARRARRRDRSGGRGHLLPELLWCPPVVRCAPRTSACSPQWESPRSSCTPGHGWRSCSLVTRWCRLLPLPPEPSVTALLTREVPSEAGRRDVVQVQLGGGQAESLFGASALLSVLTRADGYLVLPEPATDLDAGARVSVTLYR